MPSRRKTSKSSPSPASVEPRRRPSPTVDAASTPTPTPAQTASPKKTFSSFPFSGATAARTAFFLFFFWFWGVRYGDFLYMAQEYDLFLWRPDFAADAASRIAGLSRYFSAFFVQFFYYPFLGAAILAGVLVYLQYATERLFKIRGAFLALSFVPSALASIRITQTGYYLFEYCDVAYLFSFLLQYAFVLTFVLAFDALRSSRAQTAFFVVGVLATYPIFGFFALFAATLALLKAPSRPDVESISLRRRALLFPLVVATPALFWPFFSETTPTFRFAYVAGLSEESVLLKDAEFENLDVRLTAAILVFFLVAALVERFGRFGRFGRATNDAKLGKTTKNARKTKGPATIAVLALAVVPVATLRFSFYEQNFVSLLKVARALDRDDWNAILREESRVFAPINPLITARYLALTRTDRIADEAFARTVYPARSPRLETIQTYGMCGDRILYEYGALNLAARSATNNYVMKRERSTWALKTLALCSIAADRRALAERYLFRLEGTLFHRALAKKLATYLEKTSADRSRYAPYLTTLNDAAAQRCVEEFAPKFDVVRAQGPFDDRISPSNCADYIRYFYVQNDDLSRRPLREQENRLATLLVMRDLPTFAKYFDGYLAAKGSAPLPRYLGEAALLRAQYPQTFGEEPGWTIPPNANISAETRAQFAAFLQTIDASRPRERIFSDIETKFGDTFWAHAFAVDQVQNY